MPRLPHLAIILLIGACSSVPDVAINETPAARSADYPALAPLPDLLTAADAPSRAQPAATELTNRRAGLQSRAARLRRQNIN